MLVQAIAAIGLQTALGFVYSFFACVKFDIQLSDAERSELCIRLLAQRCRVNRALRDGVHAGTRLMKPLRLP